MFYKYTAIFYCKIIFINNTKAIKEVFTNNLQVSIFINKKQLLTYLLLFYANQYNHQFLFLLNKLHLGENCLGHY